MVASQKSMLYREVNMTTDAMLRQFDADEAGQFLCECQDAGCSRRLPLHPTEYEGVRRSGGFLVSLECIADSEVLLRTDSYAAVAFRAATGGSTGASPTESSRSESSPRESSQRARSRLARSLTARSRAAQSLPARPRPGSQSPQAASRRATLRLAPAEPSWASPQAPPLPDRLWHRQSQSARLLAVRVQVPQSQVPPVF